MANTIGSNVKLTVFGESHGSAIGVVLDGLAPGIMIDYPLIDRMLSFRRPSLKTDTARVENDEYQIISGVLNGYTTGSPLTIIIPNKNLRSEDYSILDFVPRPSHSDYVSEMKYHGFQDKSGGGHFSGRVTAGIVASGAICLSALKTKGIHIATHILSCGGVNDREFSGSIEEIQLVNSRLFPLIDNDVEEQMCSAILEAKAKGDSLGGKIQTAIIGLPVGLGNPWFDSLEGVISKAVFAIGGIKGIEFGAGFNFANMKGSEANDAFHFLDGKVQTLSNNSGGINGGISNGMPIVFNMAVRPTPSISICQQSVNLSTKENTVLELKGRHDPAIVRRICVVITNLIAIVLCDVLSQNYGTDWLCAK